MTDAVPAAADAAATQGRPLVLVAGLAGSGAWWRRVCPHLEAAGRAPVTIDLPGFGALAGHGRLLPIPAQAEWLAAQLAAGAAGAAGGGTGAVDLVGYSLGGAVAVRVAADHPELVRRLVLVNPGGVPAGRSELADALTAVRMSLGAGPSFWPVMIRDALRTGPRALRAAGKDVRADDASAWLPRIAAPTLILRGEHDALVTAPDAERIAALIPGAELRTLPGVGHVPLAQCPQELAAAIAMFTA